jgi:hypothetical protein
VAAGRLVGARLLRCDDLQAASRGAIGIDAQTLCAEGAIALLRALAFVAAFEHEAGGSAGRVEVAGSWLRAHTGVARRRTAPLTCGGTKLAKLVARAIGLVDAPNVVRAVFTH